MISKNQIKLIRSLKQNKFRKEHALFVAEGPKIVGEFPGSTMKVDALYALEEWIVEHQEKFKYHKAEIVRVTAKELSQISNLSAPNQVLAVCRIPDRKLEDLPQGEELILALDGIRDPGNLGTIIRTADWFGVNNIICSDDCVDVFNQKVVQASMGSITRVKVYYTDLTEYLSGVDTDIYATVMDGESIFDTRPGKGIYIIGNESNGIRPEVLRHATNKVSIPASGKAESLNASVATGVVLALANK